MFKGNDWKQGFCVYDDNDVVVNITAYGITFNVNADLEDATPTIQKQNVADGGGASEIDMTDAASGIFYVIIDAADTAAMAVGEWYFDIRFTIATKVKTQVLDVFELKAPIMV